MLPEQTLSPQIVPPGVLAPEADLFARRATRFTHLAEGHAAARWLGWLAELSTAQQHLADQQPAIRASEPVWLPGQPVWGAAARAEIQTGLPALFAALLRDLQNGGQGEWLRDIESESADAVLARADAVCKRAAGELPPGQSGFQELLVAASLQVLWHVRARSLAGFWKDLPLTRSETCPCCGSQAVGSVVLAGEGKAGLRYQVCSLCATRWNAVRAQCTLCADGTKVEYLALAGAGSSDGASAGQSPVQAECCDFCHGYSKVCFQSRDPFVDPQADDLATLALDVLVGEQGYGRASPNLFLGLSDTV